MQPAIQQELEKKKTEHLITFKVFQLLPHFSLVLPPFLSPPNQHSLLTKKKKKEKKERSQ